MNPYSQKNHVKESFQIQYQKYYALRFMHCLLRFVAHNDNELDSSNIGLCVCELIFNITAVYEAKKCRK